MLSGPDQAVNVKLGIYNCKQYVLAEPNFSCRLSQIPGHRSGVEGFTLVAASQLEDNPEGGVLYAKRLEIGARTQ